ncbi:maleylpyruvate isomerase N-terminal domain-containing protein [soil metagenome]
MSSDAADPPLPAPDDKDWTWVLDRPCPDCGFDAAALPRESIAAEVLLSTPRWRAALQRGDADVRRGQATWSVLEYGCHIRDVHTIFAARVRLILDEDNPEFENWDQDATAVQKRYWDQLADVVSHELAAAAEQASAAFTGLSPAQWSRVGRRSNGSVFTAETLGKYYLHDVAHHLYDVGA